ncbi:putative amidase-like protein [Anoxybacillus vitaminiphilus]|uniref:Putative amidase-like protein n=1 Tax=Paranoxybacillus vitaminiphilus TaxID=581036 RepID=A0A327Y3R1_9BACL|nr:putative amidase-like protein [Anoxybacillus vitaminiphilus]
MVNGVRRELISAIEKKIHAFVCGEINNIKNEYDESVKRKLRLFRKRNAEIVKCQARGEVLCKHQVDRQIEVDYVVHYQFLIRQKDWIYLEEQVEERRALFENHKLVRDQKVIAGEDIDEDNKRIEREYESKAKEGYQYDRFAAVRYAETWWNSYNLAFKKFPVDCTNFVSQCLYAGGIPMSGYPNRAKGWWMKNHNWSYSWTVAHSFRWYLSGTHSGLKAMEVSSPEQLMPGDVICYDFQGDGRFDHTTIVVAKDRQGMPLVNAHTTNSRMRYWSYEDSTAYTPNIQYKFFHIV